MATMEVHFFSESLKRNVTCNVVLPVDKRSMDGNKPREKDRPLKTLYLLHGVYGDYTEWMNNTRVALWAQDMNIAVVMPSGENKFYSDIEDSYDYFGRFVGEELVEMTRRMFHLSDKREDTYVAGLSMGGYGALATGLRYPETFGAIGAFSACLILDGTSVDDKGTQLIQRGVQGGEPISRAEFYESSLGPLEPLCERNDVYALASKCAAEGKLPAIFQSCGSSDFLLKGNRKFRDYVENLHGSIHYEEGEGAHEWNYWDKSLFHFLRWLPLEPMTPARSSGYHFLHL